MSRSPFTNLRTLAGICGLAAFAATASATDWPTFRGPARNGTLTDATANAVFPRTGPKQLWKANVEKGYSSIVCGDGIVYTMGNQNNKDTVYGISLEDGSTIWSKTYDCGNSGGFEGPRSTPTLHEGRLYTYSRESHAYCFDAKTGRILWTRKLTDDSKGKSPNWGFSGAPLIYGDLVIYNHNESGMALKKDTGEIVWESSRGKSGYASPNVFTIDGVETLLVFSGAGLYGSEPKTGKVLWFQEWTTSYDVNAADPIVIGNRIFISSNYNRGCALLEIKDGKVRKVYENTQMRNHFSTCVYVDGLLFGNDQEKLVCIDFETGEQKWSQGGLGKGGNVTLLNGKLMVLYHNGALAVAEPSATEFKPEARAQVIGGQCWTSPAVADGRLLIRNNDKGDLVCLDLR